MSNNEGKACDAVIRLLERRTGEQRANVRRPEMDGIGPPVDLRLRLGTREYAIEHTQIEAFEGQIRTGEEFGRFITPVTEQLQGTLPGPAVYYLLFPLDARLGVKGYQMGEMRSNLIAWVREHAQGLHEKSPDRPTRERNPRGIRDQYRGTPPGFSYEVVLARHAHWSFSSQRDGRVSVSRIAPGDVESLRAIRLRKALERKCPKLQRCKQEGARTVLVLEDGDIALSNECVIGDGLAGLLQERADLPDEIYLVDTSVDAWTVWLMNDALKSEPFDIWSEFDAGELVDMTGRTSSQRE